MTLDPATGALVVDPDPDRVILRALKGEVGYVAFRLYLKSFLYEVPTFTRKRRSVTFKSSRYLLCFAFKLSLDRHPLIVRVSDWRQARPPPGRGQARIRSNLRMEPLPI
jgi:hypothetical protein